MQKLVPGQKIKLSEVTSSNRIDIDVQVQGSSREYDISCFLLNGQEKLPSDDHVVFYNQSKSPQGEVQLAHRDAYSAQFQLDLSRVGSGVQRLAFTCTIDDQHTFKDVKTGRVRVSSEGNVLLEFVFSGQQFSQEKAVILSEVYFKDVWRFGAIAQGFNGGLADLVKHYGGTVAKPSPAPTPAPAPQPAPPVQESKPAGSAEPAGSAGKVNLSKITLEKRGDSGKVNLRKDGRKQPIHINLNWEQHSKPSSSGLWGLLANQPAASSTADLDLGCMFEMQSGYRGVIQALGNSFGAKDTVPYIFLDKDDRSGQSQDGENLLVLRPDLIKRVVVFAYIYQGVSTFQDVGGRMKITDDQGNEIHLKLDQPDPSQKFCAICSIINSGDHIQVTKEELYFRGHQETDEHFGFGFRWQSGQKS
ncbi:TerD family protein [Deinococcus roseus]|uniref:Tellurium resistance protein TerA n=1 Tax=Deinococcus roseus TaxID=392414 RepID=A0ABQ2D250_9DEIO|nr:TerD family protein [Deinococcus roseus]GGJ39276.1 tellurium resistance protein TerA [Deinococcus roseus]